MRRLASIAAAGILALAVSAPVAADTTGGPPGAYSDGMTITLTSTRVIARVIVAVTFDITCDAKPEGARWEDGYFSAWVKQASGRAIAQGMSDTYLNPAELCDGATHSATMSVPSDSVPFKAGTAAVAITGYAGWYQDGTCDEYGCTEGTWGDDRASTGWVTAKLGK